ncbi:hypothetical protein [Candidatus Reidiella endopervernicosa]|uniref:Uncharacterized protein n=1 Tax=Candidatus Reidiella endopervernicosa TaxID=2738883 RepID=A0A6N0HWY6_9GAMM|nr:hypothetical protein [Candidatus Reidiella endopervernicosa]QKQ26636.1 hypothetical protein HUE57_10360 [Candidatus Reidiella endopervernicosa]
MVLQLCCCVCLCLHTSVHREAKRPKQIRGVAIFAEACFGHPSPASGKYLTRPFMPTSAPTVLRSLRNHLFAALHNSLTDSTPT